MKKEGRGREEDMAVLSVLREVSSKSGLKGGLVVYLVFVSFRIIPYLLRKSLGAAKVVKGTQGTMLKDLQRMLTSKEATSYAAFACCLWCLVNLCDFALKRKQEDKDTEEVEKEKKTKFQWKHLISGCISGMAILLLSKERYPPSITFA